MATNYFPASRTTTAPRYGAPAETVGKHHIIAWYTVLAGVAVGISLTGLQLVAAFIR